MPLNLKTDTKPQLTKSKYEEGIDSYDERLPQAMTNLVAKIKASNLPDVLKIRLLSKTIEDININIPNYINTMEIDLATMSKIQNPDFRTELILKYKALGVQFDSEWNII